MEKLSEKLEKELDQGYIQIDSLTTQLNEKETKMNELKKTLKL
jgi:hypothetical protein